MKTILLAGVTAIGLAAPAHAVTATFCGPDSEGGTCEGASEVKVFLSKGKDEATGTGTVGVHGTAVVDFGSDGGTLNSSVDFANGFATITPTQGQVDFNGLDITIPGFTFKDIAFDVQLTPTSSQTDNFTITDFTGHQILVGTGMESDKADTDKQFSTTAISGIFDEVNINSLTGFDEIKHIEISGLAPIGSAVPEPSTWVMLGTGFGLLGLFGRMKLRQPRSVQL